MCGHENDPNNLVNMAIIAGGPDQLVTMELAIYNKEI